MAISQCTVRNQCLLALIAVSMTTVFCYNGVSSVNSFTPTLYQTNFLPKTPVQFNQQAPYLTNGIFPFSFPVLPVKQAVPVHFTQSYIPPRSPLVLPHPVGVPAVYDPNTFHKQTVTKSVLWSVLLTGLLNRVL